MGFGMCFDFMLKTSVLSFQLRSIFVNRLGFVFVQGYLTEEAFAAVQRLLPDSAEGDLASVCSWAEENRFHYWWSRPLHYVDTPDFRCNYEFLRKQLA